MWQAFRSLVALYGLMFSAWAGGRAINDSAILKICEAGHIIGEDMDRHLREAGALD